jgi:(p)ppGpp synthase/HD superfamily hydrolase
MDRVCIATGLLHDVVEDTATTVAEVERASAKVTTVWTRRLTS